MSANNNIIFPCLKCKSILKAHKNFLGEIKKEHVPFPLIAGNDKKVLASGIQGEEIWSRVIFYLVSPCWIRERCGWGLSLRFDLTFPVQKLK